MLKLKWNLNQKQKKMLKLKWKNGKFFNQNLNFMFKLRQMETKKEFVFPSFCCCFGWGNCG